MQFPVLYSKSSLFILYIVICICGFPGGSVVKNVLPMQEMQATQVRSLGGEDHLEKEMATHSSILAWEISWTGEPVHRVAKESDVT